jgi:hypothetical protein
MQLEEIFTQIAKQTNDAKSAEAREAKRLEKEPFPTMVKPQHKDTINALKGWKPRPNEAYVLFEKKQFNLKGEGEGEWGGGLMTLYVEARPEQLSKIDEYTTFPKNFRLLHYGHFPKLNDPNPARARIARIYSGPDGKNPWDSLERHLLSKMGVLNQQDAVVEAKDAKIRDLESRIEAMKAEVEKGKAKPAASNHSKEKVDGQA